MGDKALPYDAEIEYLESTGTAHIDTGITPTLSYSVEMEFKWVSPFSSADASATLFGCINGWNNNGYAIVYTHQLNKKSFYNCWGNNFKANDNYDLSYLLDSWHTLNFSNKKAIVDGNQIGQTSTGTGNPIGSVYLFCAKNWSNGNLYGIGTTKQIRSFKMYDASSNLVMDLIPVRKGTTGYMYDKISKRLFGNIGTGDFVLGQDIVPIEYLQSSNTQWIDTGFKPNQDTSIYMTVLIPTSNIVSRFYETRNGLWSGEYALINFGQSDNQLQTRFGNYSRGTKLRNKLDINTIYKLFMDKNSVYLDDTLIGTAPAYTFQCNYSLPLFALNNVGTVTPASDCIYRLYDCKIYDNDVLIRDYIPVRIGTTGCLLDKLTRTLYGNAGTGDFILGPDKT